MYRYIDRYRCFYLYFQLKNHQFENPLPRGFGHPCLRVDAKRVKNALSFVPIVTGFSGTSALGWLLLPFKAFWGQRDNVPFIAAASKTQTPLRQDTTNWSVAGRKWQFLASLAPIKRCRVPKTPRPAVMSNNSI